MSSGKVAAGIILFRRTCSQNIEFLLLQTSYGQHHWTPPKGHVDPGETEFRTAQRETQEEAGFAPNQYKVIDGFKETLVYNVNNKPKTVYYWLAEMINPEDPVILSHEHQAFQWLDLEKTKALSGFQDMNVCFDKAYNCISQTL